MKENEMKNTDNIENTDNDIGEHDQDITSPFSIKDIKVTHATVMLPTIINRLKIDEIGIPDYQRNPDLWTANQKSRLIESILLKLPLPVFYFDVSNPEKWMVIDGLQRISTIRSFFVEKTLKLKGLEFLKELNGKKCNELLRSMQRTIEDTMFVVYQIEAQTPKEVRYSIFNRINTGGLSLKPQEIRQALNQQGKGVKFLRDTVADPVFEEVVGISSKRMAGQELVLRFMAFKLLDDVDQFKIMSSFLDLAMEEVDKKNEEELKILKNDLIEILEFSEQVLGKRHRFSRSIADESKNKLVNLSLFDVLTVCFDEIQDKELFLQNKDFFVAELKTMLNKHDDFLVSITKGTSGKWAKNTRFKAIRSLIKQTLEDKE